MEIRQGYSYHIKEEFFDMIQDKKNPDLYWMIPISSQIEKYKKIVENKKKKYGKCNTIIIGKFAGKENAFLIQNTFPIIAKYFDHIHMIENKPVTIHSELNRILTENLKEVLAINDRGIKLIFTDIAKIKEVMEKELESRRN